MSENKNGTEYLGGALLHILENSPLWLRALVLIALLLTGISVAGTFIVAVISGRSVEFWPPKVGQYESPSVQQCKVLIDFVKDSELAANQQIAQFHATMDTQNADLAKRRDTALSEAKDNTIGQSKANDNVAAAEKGLGDTTQKILEALTRIEATLQSVQQKCAPQ
jgi:hypothetical protein